MWRFIKQLLAFRVGQKSTKGAARMLGFGKIGTVLGLIGGFRAMKRHRHA
jgi:hypothetical protein